MDSTDASKNGGDDGKKGRARGGEARARKMTSVERSEAASHAARDRWKKEREVTDAICGSPDQKLCIGDVEIECYVLEDGTRVLTQATFLSALGRHPRAKSNRGRNLDLPPILQGKAIEPYLADDLGEGEADHVRAADRRSGKRLQRRTTSGCLRGLPEGA